VRVENFVFGNPPETATSPAFLENSYFLRVENVKFTCALNRRTIIRGLKLCMRLALEALKGMGKAKEPRLARQIQGAPHPWEAIEPLGEVIFSDISMNKINLNFTLSPEGNRANNPQKKLPSTFNINALTTMLAEGDVKACLKKGKPLPNCLDIRVIRARGLRPMDVCHFSGGKSSDPYVRLTARDEKRWTSTSIKNLNPMWNERFTIHVPDPSTVLHVEVMDEDFVKSDKIGSWIITLKWLMIDPQHCRHNPAAPFTVTKSADGYPTVRGWFSLGDENGDTEDAEGNMLCGEVEMEMTYRYNRTYDDEKSPSRKTALEQLKENSAETQLRLGPIPRVINRLEAFPLRFRVHRWTLRDISVDLKDMFAGYDAHNPLVNIESKGDQGMRYDTNDGIVIGVLYVSKALRGSHDIWQILKKFGVAVLEEATARGLWSATSQTFVASMHGVGSRWYHWLHHTDNARNNAATQQEGEQTRRRLAEWQDSWSTMDGNDRHMHTYRSGMALLRREFQHMNFTRRSFQVLHERELSAADVSFLAKPTRAGFVLRAVGSVHHTFSTHRIELRGDAFYVHAANRHGRMKRVRHTWQRISISDLRYAWKDDQGGVLVLQGKYAVDYLRDVPDKAKRTEGAFVDNPTLDDWFGDAYRILSLARSRHADGTAAGVAHVISHCDFDDESAAQYKKVFAQMAVRELADVVDFKPKELVTLLKMKHQHATTFMDAVKRNMAARKAVQTNALYNDNDVHENGWSEAAT
jgi:hypothetical protein